MTALFLDGFDKYANTTEVQDVWQVSNGTWNFASSGGRFGGGALEATQTGTFFTKDLPAPFTLDGTTLFNIGFSFKTAASATANSGALLNLAFDNTGETNAISAGSSGQHLSYYYKPSTNTIQGSATVLDGLWHWIECSWLYKTSTGTFAAYVDGVLDASISGVTTQAAGSTTLNTIQFQPGNCAGNTVHDAFIDDVVVWTSAGSTFNTFPLGPQRIQTSAPTSNGDVDQFTPSSGSNYQCVNQGYSSAAFVSDSGTGNTDLYHFAPLSYSPAVINTVCMNYYGQNSGSGTATLNPKCKTSGSTSSTGGQTLAVATNKNFQGFFDKDGTGSAWTGTNVNASQFGMTD